MRRAGNQVWVEDEELKGLPSLGVWAAGLRTLRLKLSGCGLGI